VEKIRTASTHEAAGRSSPPDIPERTGDENRIAVEEVAYVGEWTPLGRAVLVQEHDETRPLRLAESALAHGYVWGRAGAGPREVARAILIDATGNEMLAERLCRPLTWEVITELPAGGFRLSKAEILGWVADRTTS
jgi:hypothetical protein